MFSLNLVQKHVNGKITILPLTFYTFYNLLKIAQNTKHAKFEYTLLRSNVPYIHTSPYISFISHFSPSIYYFCNLVLITQNLQKLKYKTC